MFYHAVLDRRSSHNISNTRDSVSSGYPKAEKRAENTARSGVFSKNAKKMHEVQS